MNPMIIPMLPFIMYQRWLETVFLPFLDSFQGQANAVINEAKSVQNEVVDTTKAVVKYQG